MSEQEIDDYLDQLDERARRALNSLRSTILRMVPDAEQGMSYGVPAFRIDGRPVAGFAAFTRHLSYFPHSESVLPEVADELGGYSTSAGTLRFSVDEPLPEDLVRRLLEVRMGEITP